MGTFDCATRMTDEKETCDESFDSLIEMHQHRHEEHGCWLPELAKGNDDE